MTKFKKIFAAFLEERSKGAGGTILVIGGSEMYTGAVEFATYGALRAGGELIYILSPNKTNVGVLKHISEAIVCDLRFDERILNRITACVVGSGLGRISDDTLDMIIRIVKYLDNRGIYTIVDADAIHYYKEGVFNNMRNIILTPNSKERKNLVVFDKNHYSVNKGKSDEIFQGDEMKKQVVIEDQNKKRCAGQGDLLAGVISAIVSTGHSDVVECCELACLIVKQASKDAFNRLGFGCITSDIVEQIPFALQIYTPTRL